MSRSDNALLAAMRDSDHHMDTSSERKLRNAKPPTHSNRQSSISSVPALHRRLLFPHLPPSAAVPQIFPTASPELDTEIYDFIALALRAYVSPWWAKISRHDKEFIPYISSVLLSVIKSLAIRLENADIPTLLCRDIPLVVAQHYEDYHLCTAKLRTSYAAGGAASLPQLFHQSQSHVAIDTDGQINPEYLRLYIDNVLKVCLPPVDYESEAERYIIIEVILRVLLEEIIARLVQPWYIYKLLLQLLKQESEVNKFSVLQAPGITVKSGVSLHTMVVYILSGVQFLSGLALILVQYYHRMTEIVRRASDYVRPAKRISPRNYGNCIMNMTAAVFTMRERAASNALLVISNLIIDSCPNFIDKMVSFVLSKHFFNETQSISALRSIKVILFPNGYPASPAPDATPEEQIILKEELLQRIEQKIPRLLCPLIFGPPNSTMRRDSISAIIEPLSNPQCNSHLALFIIDVILLSTFPELASDTPESQLTSLTTGPVSSANI